MALALQIGAEPRTAAEQIVDMAARDKRTAALLDAYQTLIGQRTDSAADGVTIDPEARREIRFGRQAAVGEAALADFLREALGNLAPARDALSKRQNCHISLLQ